MGQWDRHGGPGCLSYLLTAGLQPSHHQCRPDAEVFVTKTNITIGSVYKKAVYRQYTDARFNQRVRCDSREAHACARCSGATHLAAAQVRPQLLRRL